MAPDAMDSSANNRPSLPSDQSQFGYQQQNEILEQHMAVAAALEAVQTNLLQHQVRRQLQHPTVTVPALNDLQYQYIGNVAPTLDLETVQNLSQHQVRRQPQHPTVTVPASNDLQYQCVGHVAPTFDSTQMFRQCREHYPQSVPASVSQNSQSANLDSNLWQSSTAGLMYANCGASNLQMPQQQNTQDWHGTVQLNERNQNVIQLIQALSSTSVKCATKCETEIYQRSTSKIEYNSLVAEKIRDIQSGFDGRDGVSNLYSNCVASSFNAPATTGVTEVTNLQLQFFGAQLIDNLKECYPVQKRISLFLHAQKCQLAESLAFKKQHSNCNIPNCVTMKSFLDHIITCLEGANCKVKNCMSTKQILGHWKSCKQNFCPICLPLRDAEKEEQGSDASNPMQMSPNTEKPGVQKKTPDEPARPTQEEPILVPINGIVQPPVVPSPGRPGRVTNQLQQMKSVVNSLWTHASSRHFREPIDAVKLGLLDYHEIIKNPMDLGTVKSRLKNKYYWSARECMRDLNSMFTNCYVYYPSTHEIIGETLALESFYLSEVSKLDKEEVVIQPKQSSNTIAFQSLATTGIQPVQIVVKPVFQPAGPAPLRQLPSGVIRTLQEQQHLLNNVYIGPLNQQPKTRITLKYVEKIRANRMASHYTGLIGGNTLMITSDSPQQMIFLTPNQLDLIEMILRKNLGDKNEGLNLSDLTNVDQNVAGNLGDKNESLNQSNLTNVDQKAGENSQIGTCEKQKVAESCEQLSGPLEQEKKTITETVKSKTSETIAQKNDTVKNLNKPDEIKQIFMPILEKLYNQDPDSLPFRKPVDPLAFDIPDYFDIIQKPMDLSTLKIKLENGSYTDPWQFVDDVWLMFQNAWFYYSEDSETYKFSTKLAEIFKNEMNPLMEALGHTGEKFLSTMKKRLKAQILSLQGQLAKMTLPVENNPVSQNLVSSELQQRQEMQEEDAQSQQNLSQKDIEYPSSEYEDW